MISIQYFATEQDIKKAYGNNVPSNVVCVAGNNDSVLINTSNNNPHADKEEQDKPTIVNKINNQDITVEPTKETIILKHNDEYTGLGTVTVRAVTSSIDVNIASNNIKEGVTILGVEGTLKEEKPEERFDVQPTTTEQTITPTEGSVFSGGTVHAVTSAIDGNIQPENIKQGVSILGITGTLSSGGGSDVFVVPPEMRFGYSTFTEIPSNWDFREFSNVTDASFMFINCTSLTAIPQMDTSKITNALQMFSGCESLTTIPLLNLSSLTTASSMFSYCTNLTTIPQLDLSSVTSTAGMFQKCTSLTTIPQLDLSSVTEASNMFSNCTSLTAIPQMDTSKVTNLSNMFLQCKSLTTVEGIDFSGLTSNLERLFGSVTSMPTITRFIVNGKINVNATGRGSIAALTAIDYDSVKSILEAANRTDNNDSKELAFNRTMTDQNGELAALVASCTSKGWTISGLTLN